MKHHKARSTGPQPVPVRFEFTHPTAVTVCVAGTFNQWQPEAKPMHPLGGGRWLKETVLPPGTYEYGWAEPSSGDWFHVPIRMATSHATRGATGVVLFDHEVVPKELLDCRPMTQAR